MTNTNATWWQQYRKMVYKRPIKISKERLIRTSLRKVFKEFYHNSNISSFINNTSYVERICWLIVFIFVNVLLLAYFHGLRRTILSKPFVISTESTVRPIEKIKFPAVAFCNINRVSKRAASALAKMSDVNVKTEELEEIVSQLGKLINFEPENENITSFNSKIALEKLVKANIVKVMEYMAQPCDKMLLRCAWNGILHPCDKLFTLCLTSHGHCCCFNYLMDYNEMGRPVQIKREVKGQRYSGIDFGLSVVLDPDIEDYSYPIRNTRGFDVLVFDPEHYPDHNSGHIIHRMIYSNSATLMQVRTNTQFATDEVRRYSVDMRKCLFKDERPAEYGTMYSYSSCIISCRIRTVLSLCKCVPYYLPSAGNTSRVCTLFDLRCLNKFRDKLYNIYPKDRQSDDGVEVELQDSMYCPECLPDCEFTKYYTKASIIPLFAADLGQKRRVNPLTDGLDLVNKTAFVLYVATPHSTLNKLDVVSYWFEITSLVAGSAALLLGYTIITIAEAVYFFTYKFIITVREINNENNIRNYNY